MSAKLQRGRLGAGLCVLFSRLLGSSYSAPCVAHQFKELQLLSWLTVVSTPVSLWASGTFFSLFVTFCSFSSLGFSHSFFPVTNAESCD